MTFYNRHTQNYLTDGDVKNLLDAGKLFMSGTYDINNISGCAYDLRAGDKYTSRNREKAGDLSAGEYVVQPGEIITVRTEESVDFSEPLLMGLICNCHTILSQGLLHPLTIIDPGFKGQLTITLILLGNVPFKIRRQDRLAKLLISPVYPKPSKIYGVGYRPRVGEGSIEHSLYAERSLKSNLTNEELSMFVGGPISQILTRIEILERDADLYRIKKKLSGYDRVGSIALMLAAGAGGGLLAKLIGDFIAMLSTVPIR